MDTWESFFREKSRRRYRNLSRMARRAIVIILVAEAATVVAVIVTGVLR